MHELLALAEEDREIAMQRFRWLQPHLEENRSLRLVAAEAGLAFRTAQRWVALYRASGLASLARKTLLDHGARKVVSESMKRAIEGLALESHPVPITSVHRQIKEYAEAIGDTVPSYWTVYDIVREVPPSLRTLAHQGAKSYGESFDLIHRREASKPNSIWQADHAQLDIKLLKEDGSTARPWLTIVIDDYSRAIAGYYLGFDAPSSIRISLALRQGVWRKGHPHWQICGVPDILYTDNGADFTSKHLQQVAADLKIRLVFSIPGKPQGRGRIERFFRTVNEMFLCDLDGYIRCWQEVRRGLRHDRRRQRRTHTQIKKFGTIVSELQRLAVWLVAEGCTHAVMESTGSYWKPVFNLLEAHVRVILANAADVQNRRGHKTDPNDSRWLAHLLRHGMIRPSFIPPLAIRELRDLTRRRRQLIGENSRERNRVQKVLEDANVKFGDVLSDVFCVSGKLMLAALLDGRMTAEQIADLAKKKAREKIPQIMASVADHRLSDHQRFLIRHALRHLEFLDEEVEALNGEIRRRMKDSVLAEAFHLLQSIPGITE